MNKIINIINNSEIENNLKPNVNEMPCAMCKQSVVLETKDMIIIYCKTFFKNVWTSHKQIDIKNCSDFTKFEENI